MYLRISLRNFEEFSGSPKTAKMPHILTNWRVQRNWTDLERENHPHVLTDENLSNQGLLKLLWTVYSEEKLQSCLKLRNVQNPFNKTYHAQKRPKICTCCRVSEAKFYLYHSTKIAKAGPGYDEIRILKIFKADFLKKTLLIRISQLVYKKYHAQKKPKICTHYGVKIINR